MDSQTVFSAVLSTLSAKQLTTMKIILAKNAGFCWGVKRVVKITEEEI